MDYPEELARLSRLLFDTFDKNNDGKITPEEFREGLKIVGAKFTDQQVEDLLKRCDVDHNGYVNLAEFMLYSLGSPSQFINDNNDQ